MKPSSNQHFGVRSATATDAMYHNSNGQTQSHSRNPSSQIVSGKFQHRSLHASSALQQSHQVSHSLASQIIDVEVQKQSLLQRERSCKTTSPTQFKNNESRLRKRSKDIPPKREGLADLIVVLGLKYNEFVGNQQSYNHMLQSKNEFSHKQLKPFQFQICFPQRYRVKSFEKKKEGKLCKYKTFHFIITNQDGEKKYITSILFKELFLSEKRGAFIVPKSICIVSSRPIFMVQKQLLELIFKKVIVPNNSDSIRSYDHSQSPQNYIPYMNMLNEDLIRTNADSYLMQRFEFYLTVFFKHLYYSEEIEYEIEVEQITEKKSTTTNKSVKKSSNREITRFFRYRNTKSYGFTLENYSYELLLSLKPERIMFLINALLLERKIILIKKEFGDIALIMESLVSLLNPLKWNFVFITYLTPKLIDCLEAPFPYIIGVSRKIWEDHCQMREFPDDIIIYDIDLDNMLNKVKEELPPLPQPQASVLQRTLKELLDMKERFTETLQEQLPKQIAKDKIEEFYWAYAQLKVKQRFFNFFLLSINNYIGCFKNLDEDGNLSPNKKDKKYYDKLSSIDIFDFDSYTNLFEGENKEFIGKLVHTQSFNNFIEDTYRNQSPQTPIGFFKTNFDVMIEHSFKRLEKEQNKLIQKIFFNLQNPVRFNISHMFKLYKKGILKQHQKKMEQRADEVINDLEQQDTINLHSEDQLEQMLLSYLENNPNHQQSLINQVGQELITDMPGIEYEKISTYRQLKQQKSEPSLDRNLNKSMNAFEFNQRTQQESQTQDKSRNYQVVNNSRSGGPVAVGGNVYKNYLSMADNKRQNEEQIQSSLNRQNEQLFSYDDKRNYNQNRVHSENSFVLGSLNKTVIVNSQHLNRAPTTVQKTFDSKAKTLRFDRGNLMNKTSTTLQQLMSNQRGTSSPRLISKPRIEKNTSSLSQSSFLVENSQQFNNFKLPMLTSTKSALKHTNDRKVQQQRTKHAIHLKSEENRNIVNQSVHLLQQQLSPYNHQKEGEFPQSNKANSSFLNSKNWKQQIPKTNINLMDPQKKKISRNEERMLAKQRGFLRLDHQNSFISFNFAREEECNPQVQPNIIRNDSLVRAQNENQSFSYFCNSNYNSNVSDDEYKIKMQNSLNNQQNQITFKKRHHKERDPLSTTINFQSTFIKQKSQIQQSPVVTSTDLSNSKFSLLGKNDEDMTLDSQSPNVNHNSSKRRDVINRMKYGSPLQIGFNQMQPIISQSLSTSAKVDRFMEKNNTSVIINPHLSQFKKSLMRQHHYQKQKSEQLILDLQQTSSKIDDGTTTITKEDGLLVRAESTSVNTPSQHISLGQKHPQIRQSESPGTMSINASQQSITFKSFINNHSNNNQNMSKRLSQAGNKSPPITTQKQQNSSKVSSKLEPSAKNKKVSQMSTFDNSNRTETLKQSNNAVLSRKRSTPAFAQDKLQPSAQQPLHPQKALKSSNDLPKVDNKSSSKISNIKASKTQQIKQPTTLQISLDGKTRKPKGHQTDQEEFSLRVSPLPDLELAISQALEQSLLEVQKTEAKPGNKQKKSLSKAYQSVSARDSDKIFAHKKKAYDPKKQVVEIEIFDKAQSMFQGPLSTRNHDNGNSMISKTSRGSTSGNRNIINKFQTRTSNISQEQLLRVSDSRHENATIESKSFRQSDILSNDESNNVSISGVRSSPKLVQQQKNQKPPLNVKNNFMVMSSQSLQMSADFGTLGIANTLKNDNIMDADKGSSQQSSENISPRTYFNKQSMIEEKKVGKFRTSSLEDYQQEEVIDTVRDSKPNKINKQNIIRKKQAKSPQPSSQMISSNLYLRSIQNQDYLLKQKTQKSNRKQTIDISSAYQSNQNVKHVSIQQQVSSKINKHHNKMSLEAKDLNSKYHSVKEVCQSTKNLYGGINREQLLIEISNINETLNRPDQVSATMGVGSQKTVQGILEKTNSSQSNQSQQHSNQQSPRQAASKSLSIINKNMPGDFPSSMFLGKHKGFSSKNIDPKSSDIFDKFQSRQIKDSESENELVIIDLPRQMPPGDFTRLKSQDQIPVLEERKSQLIDEIDKLMEERPFRQLHQGLLSSKNFKGVRSQQESFTRDRSGSTHQFSQQPLIELKYNSNELPIRVGQNANPNQNSHHNGTSSSSLNNSKIFIQTLTVDKCSRHSYLANKAVNSLAKQKKRSIRHGLTTCLIFPNKESAQYVRRDLNQDTFCKITSHRGDIDNDPHTPKSNGSLRSNEKSRRKEQQMRHQHSQGILLSNNLLQQMQREQQIAVSSYDLMEISPQRKYSVNAVQSSGNCGSFEIAPLQENNMQILGEEVKESIKSKCLSNYSNAIAKDMCSKNTGLNVVKYEVLFDDADLKDTDDKFTSRDMNFDRLKHVQMNVIDQADVTS